MELNYLLLENDIAFSSIFIIFLKINLNKLL